MEGYAVNGVDLEADSGDVAHGSGSGAADALDEDLVVFVDVVEGSVAGEECGGEAAVLDELDPDALADGGVGLLGLDADLLKDDASAHGGAL